jgi:hypothetical protein
MIRTLKVKNEKIFYKMDKRCAYEAPGLLVHYFISLFFCFPSFIMA